MAVKINEGTQTTVLTTQIGGTEAQVVGVESFTHRHADEFATVVSSGTSTLGTIKPLVSGSQIFITDLIVSAGSATDVEIGDGGTANPIVGTLHFGQDGGMAVTGFKVYPRTTAGSALVYKQSANIPMTITCNGFVD